MKKLLALFLLISSFSFGMKPDDVTQEVEQEDQVPDENTAQDELLLNLFRIANESGAPVEALHSIFESILKDVKDQAKFNLPLELVIYILDILDFSCSVEALKFLVRLSSLNRYFERTLKPAISDIINRKFDIPEENLETFFKLVKYKGGIPNWYLHKLLTDPLKQEKVLKLREQMSVDLDKGLIKDNVSLNKGVKSLVLALQEGRDEDAMDIMVAFPKAVYESNVGEALKFLIDNNREELLNMLLRSGIDVDEFVIALPYLQRLVAPMGHIRMHPLAYAVFYNNLKMVI